MHHNDILPGGSGEQRLACILRHEPAMRGHRLGSRLDLAGKARPRRSFRALASPAQESDRVYFGRRSQEERRAAASAAGAAARRAHDELAVRYRQLAGRQDALLDEALKQTFPASDPVGIIRVD